MHTNVTNVLNHVESDHDGDDREVSVAIDAALAAQIEEQTDVPIEQVIPLAIELWATLENPAAMVSEGRN